MDGSFDPILLMTSPRFSGNAQNALTLSLHVRPTLGMCDERGELKWLQPQSRWRSRSSLLRSA